jgi:V/A-type H+-transporting ATPase subunit A
VHPLQSYAVDPRGFAAWWATQGNDAWWSLRRRFLSLLEEQARLERMARIIGKDALPPRQQLALLCAELLNEGFLRQSAFSPIDRVAPPAKQGAMMRLLARFMDLAEDALAAGARVDAIAALPCLRPLARMGEEIPHDQPQRFVELQARIEAEFGAVLAAATGDADAPAAAG